MIPTPFDSAQGPPFNTTQGPPFDSAQGAALALSEAEAFALSGVEQQTIHQNLPLDKAQPRVFATSDILKSSF
jgi:hypothetical protein